MALTPDVGATIDLATTQASRPFLQHKKTPGVTLTSSSFRFGGVVDVDQVKTIIVADIDATSPFSTVAIEIHLYKLDLSRFGVEKIAIDEKITLSFSTEDGKLKVNDKVLDSDPPNGETQLGNGFFLAIDGTKVGLDIEIPTGTYTYRSLVKGIPGSKIDFAWNRFRIRLWENELSLAAVPGVAADDVLGTATFTLPLIQAAIGDVTTNALAKLVPTQSPALTPLTFKVTIKRPTGSTDVAPLVYWSVKLSEKVGTFAENIGSKLRGVFESDSSGDIDGNTELSSFFAPLQELAGKAGDVLYFRLSQVKSLAASEADFIAAIQELDAFNTGDYPLPLALKIGKDARKPDLVFLVVLHINLWEGRLSSNRAYFYVASGTQILDLSAFAVRLPARTIDGLIEILKRTKDQNDPLRLAGLPDADRHDGYLDFETLDVVLDALPALQTNRPQLAVFFPSGLDKNANGDIKPTDEEKRVRILLEDFDPAVWPEKPTDKNKTLQLRLGARGLTFSAKADTVKEAKIAVSGAPFVPLRLVESRDGLRSGLVVIDNQVRYANLAGRIEVPGFDKFEADVALGLRRGKPNEPPVVTAVIDIERTDRKPLARLKVPMLKAQLDDLRMQLTWTKKSDNTSDWDFRAWATGAISITSEVGSTGGIEGLDQPRAIPFRDLDLTRLHKGDGQIPLGRPVNAKPDNAGAGDSGPADSTPSNVDQVARFELLEKQFRIEFYNSVLHWNVEEKTASFEVERARFEYQASSGDLDVAIEAGKIKLIFNGRTRSLKFETPSSFGLQVRIGTQLSFAGNVGWEDTPTENFFRADGRLQMTGFPEVAGSLKLGTGVKDDGKIAPNLAIFAELPYEADLFSGVVLKRVGLGLGLNNRLAGIGERPDPRAILANLDRIDPKQSRNWSFVSKAGVYVSVVATAMIASNRGKDDVVCAYVAKLLLSIDTNIDIVAAAQVWLFSSPGYIIQADHERRPTLIGAAVLSARERTFSLVAQTTPGPAIESNQMLSDLLSRVQARFSFYLSSDLADFYLEELSYRDQLFGINIAVAASYRIAIGRFGALMRATLAIRGELPEKKLQGGIGGFSFRGNFGLDADFGGLVSSRGLAAYGAIRVGISLRVSAFVNIPTVAWETIEFDKTFSITVSIPYLHCKRWKCKWKRREISETVTVRIKLVYPVFSIEAYHLPESSLDLVLEGVLAFDESGGIGFSGTMAISTSVCGHNLRIAPRFDYQPEVATNVRRRVAAVEDQINSLRGLPRAPVQNLPANTEMRTPPVETWYYYKSVSGDKVYHLLVPSPEYPSWWYTPYAADMRQYANLPRDTAANASENENVQGIASDLEKLHLSPFRHAVMRMMLPFKGQGDEIETIVDLAMPWDRGNYDSLPDKEDDQTLIDLVMKLTQIESAFLNTAAKADAGKGEREAWDKQEDPGIPLTDVEIVSDPRPESSARVYWTLTDQMTRPDGVYPYRYRPVQELVSKGFNGISRRGDIGRLLRYDQISRHAVAQSRYEDAAPRAARRLKNARASLLSTIIADFTREQGPVRYGPLEEIKLVRIDEDMKNTPVVTRRRFAIPISPKGTIGSQKFVVNLTYAMLENSTDLDLGLDENNQADLKWTVKDTSNSGTITLNLTNTPKPDDHNARHESLAVIELGSAGLKELHYQPVTIEIERTTKNTTDAKGAPTKAVLQFIPVPLQATPQVGLVAVTSTAENLDLRNVRIFRNESSSELNNDSFVEWSNSRQVRIIPMNGTADDTDPIEAVQRWVRCLPPCQEFLTNDSDDQNEESAKPARVRVRLPVKFDEQLLKAELPRLNGFEIYRRFPWDPQPVKIAEGVPPVLRTVEEGGRAVLLVESFLFGEDFAFDRKTGRFTGIASAVIPGVTPIEYSLRAIPFGRVTLDRRPTFRRFPAVTLHIPPVEKMLPPLGIVVPVDNLFEKTTDWNISIHLVDSRHATWEWPEKSWEELEIWAEPKRIRSSGSYAVEGEPPEVDARAAARQTIREPSDLIVERIPESVSGKILVAQLQRPEFGAAPVWKLDAGKALLPGFGYRFFIRPAVSTQTPLVQPLALHLIRELPPRMNEATPVLHVDRLELIEKSEIGRVMMPLYKGSPRKDAWLQGSDFRIVSRTEDADPHERLRISWEHSSDLDAGVEILLQDVDEPHRVDRLMVTAQEEAVFQMAIQDFRNPALWRAFPNRKSFKKVWDTIDKIKKEPPTPLQNLTSAFLWAHESNPAIARIKKVRGGNQVEGQTVETELKKFAESDDQGKWVDLHAALRGYIAALHNYQRTPLAPATPEDRAGLELLVNLSQAVVLALNLPSAIALPATAESAREKASKFTAMRVALDDKVQQLHRLILEIENIDLSQLEVNDSPAAYDKLKLRLHDIDIAKKLAAIASRRLAIAEDLLDLTVSVEKSPDSEERLPFIEEWQALVKRFKTHFRLEILTFHVGASTVLNLREDHTLEDGERIEFVDVEQLAGQEFVVAVKANDRKILTIHQLDSTKSDFPSLANVLIERVISRLAGPLVRMFEDGPDGKHATGQQASKQLKDLLALIRDPSLLLPSDAPDKKYREEVARLVPLVSGMVAGLDALKTDAQANNWTLIRRTHHSLAVKETNEGRKPIKEPLAIYLPDEIGGPNPREGRPNVTETRVQELDDQDLVIPFVNLIERLGCAIDLAVVDALNQPLPQSRLLEWIGNQPWASILGTVTGSNNATLVHEVAIVTGREPDSERNDVGSNDEGRHHHHEDRSLGYAFVKLVVVPRSMISDCLNERLEFARWLEERSLLQTVNPDTLVTKSVAVSKMAVAWWNSIILLPGTPKDSLNVGHCIVETRGRRWATVPVLGGRAHIDWTASDAAGRLLKVALRRVSRYEGLLRWARGTAVPILPRIHRLTTMETQTVPLRRRMVLGEEPQSLPVLISPHPTRIEFIYSLPTSGARATVSGLSARRTGYQGIAAQFSHKRIDGPTDLTVMDLIESINSLDSLSSINITDYKTTPNSWTVTPDDLVSQDIVVVFSKDRTHVALAIFTPVNTSGRLDFVNGELQGFNDPHNKAMINPHKAMIAKNGFVGKLELVGGTGGNTFRLIPQDDSVPMSEATLFHKGQLLLTIKSSGEPVHARLIEDFRVHDQTITLNAKLNLNGINSVLILAGVTPPSRTPVAHIELGIPNLFRHERLVSLSDLPYFRKYKVWIEPRFDGTEISNDSISNPEPESSDLSYAERRPSVLSLFKPQLIRKKESNVSVIHSFRLFLSRQGDLLTPKEIQTDMEMSDPDVSAKLLQIRSLAAHELPDLNCTYQILWELPDSSATDPIYAELVEVLLPGSPQWSKSSSGSTLDPKLNPVLLRNRKVAAVTLKEPYVPIQLWWPSHAARPVYVVEFKVNVTVSDDGTSPGDIFKEPARASLQMQRDGYRTRPVKFNHFDHQ